MINEETEESVSNHINTHDYDGDGDGDEEKEEVFTEEGVNNCMLLRLLKEYDDVGNDMNASIEFTGEYKAIITNRYH